MHTLILYCISLANFILGSAKNAIAKIICIMEELDFHDIPQDGIYFQSLEEEPQATEPKLTEADVQKKKVPLYSLDESLQDIIDRRRGYSKVPVPKKSRKEKQEQNIKNNSPQQHKQFQRRQQERLKNLEYSLRDIQEKILRIKRFEK